MLLATPEDVGFTKKDIYLTYIDFINALSSIDHDDSSP